MDLPKPISLPQFDAPSGPSYTDIFLSTLGPAGTEHDGYDAKAAELASVSAAFGAELDADPLGGHLGAAGVALGGVDPAALDLHMDGYTGTRVYALGIVAAAGAVVEPQLLTLPLTPGDGSVAFIAPKQLTHDFGTAKLGSAAQSYFVGKETDTPTGQTLGVNTKGFVVTAPAIFSEAFVTQETNLGFVHTEWSIEMTPAMVGQWTAQYEYIDEANRQLVILTLTVNVTT